MTYMRILIHMEHFFLNRQNICNTIQTLSGHRIHDVEAMRRIPALDRRAFNFVRKCVKTIILQNIMPEKAL